MSLNVYLDMPESQGEHTAIFIRENGSVKEITRAEWNEKFPGREPITVSTEESIYSANITHNLGKLADEAGLYQVMWRPDENGYEYAHQIIDVLEVGLEKLKANPIHFKQFNPENGWGDYNGLIAFVEHYLNACERYPMAKIRVSR